MSAPPPDPVRSFRQCWPVAVPVIVAFVYAFGHLGWYLATPLGRVPVLDERENLALANAIAGGTLPAEPFYRALGYALALAGLRELGVTAAGLFSAALALGATLHAANAGLVARLARGWFGDAAALAAGLLCALHPVFVHYATQALDAAPALTLFLLGLNFLAPAFAAPVGARLWLGASLCWAAAALLRPNYLLVWAALPLLAWTNFCPGARPRRLVTALGGVALFAALAVWQWRVSGAPGFLPTQGPYNFWAANQPGTHGRYYSQQLSLPPELAEKNPARAESMLLFERDTGRPATDLGTVNAYWRQRALGEIAAHPLAWLEVMARKTYALLNDWEQYNNKTFAFHQARSPWLRWNPLSWGILFVLGVAGTARLFAERPRVAPALALIVAASAASVVLFFVSARFRLPLAALLCVVAGGALSAPLFWRTWPQSRQIALGGALFAAAALTFSTFDHVRDRATFVQDHALLARAAATVGDDALAWPEANAALAQQPHHPDALRVAVAAYFNELLSETAPAAEEARWADACRRLLAAPGADAPDLRAVAALALWRAHQQSAALAEWRRLGPTPSALAARLLVGDETARRADFAQLPATAWNQPLVRLAAATLDLPSPRDVPREAKTRSAEIVARLFATSPLASPP